MDRLGEDSLLIERYLLGGLDPKDLQRVEESILTRDEFLDELEAEEDGLLDEYIEGTMSGQRRVRFEERYLATPVGKDRLILARALARYASKRGQQPVHLDRTVAAKRLATLPSRARSLAFAAAVLVFVTFGVVWLIKSGRLHKAQRDNLAVTATLFPGADRGGAGKLVRVALDSDISILRLRMELDSPTVYSRYNAVLQTSDGADLFNSGELTADSTATPVVTISVPARLLKRGDYVVRLSAWTGSAFEPMEPYYFRVLKK